MSQATLPPIPEEGMKRLRDIQSRFPTQITMEQLTAETYALYNDPVMQKDPVLKTADQKLNMCTKAVKNKYNTRTPLDKYAVIVCGMDKESNFDGDRKATAYFIVQEKKEGTNEDIDVIRHCDFAGADCDKLKTINTGMMYEGVELIHLTQGRNFKADDRAFFKDGQQVDNILELIRAAYIQDQNTKEYHRPREVTIAQAAANFPSEVKTAKLTFADKNDIVIVHAMVGNRSDKGNYTINDETVDRQDIIVEATVGKLLIKKAFNVWCNPVFAVVSKNNEGYFIGTFKAEKGSKANPKPEPYEVTMNACLVVPDRIIFS